MSFKDKIWYVFKNVSVEPMLACYIIPLFIATLANQNLSLEKACRVNLQYSESVCDALTARKTHNLTDQETHVQQLVADMAVWRTAIGSLIPGILIMFIGSWSDRRRRRKLFMLIPIVGEFFSSVSLIVCTYFFYELPMEVGGLFECFFPSLAGGSMVMNMAVFSYIGDITTIENRTLRVGIVNVFASGGVPIALSISGILLKRVGFYGVFCITASTYIVGLIFGILFIKEISEQVYTESDIPHLNSVNNKQNEAQTQKNCIRKYSGQTIHFLKDFFDIQHIKDTFRVFFTGSKNRRQRVCLLFIVFIVVMGPMCGEMTVMYLFMRYRFNWDEVQFSMFSTYSVITHLIGTSFSVGVFSHLLKIDDALIGVMSCTSKILAGFMYAFAQTEWQVYLAPLVDIVNGTSYIAMRSIASKLVPPEELGKLNSLYGACEALTPLLYGPMYAFVYAHTMDTMPGAFFLLGGALTLPAIVIFGWMYKQHRGDRLLSQNSRKSSLAEDVIKNFRIDSLAVTPNILDSSNNQQESEMKEGQMNVAFEGDHCFHP